MVVEAERDPLIGTTVLASHRIIKKLGQGGMGALYLARNPNIGSQVAVKTKPGSRAKAPKGGTETYSENALAVPKPVNADPEVELPLAASAPTTLTSAASEKIVAPAQPDSPARLRVPREKVVPRRELRALKLGFIAATAGLVLIAFLIVGATRGGGENVRAPATMPMAIDGGAPKTAMRASALDAATAPTVLDAASADSTKELAATKPKPSSTKKRKKTRAVSSASPDPKPKSTPEAGSDSNKPTMETPPVEKPIDVSKPLWGD